MHITSFNPLSYFSCIADCFGRSTRAASHLFCFSRSSRCLCMSSRSCSSIFFKSACSSRLQSDGSLNYSFFVLVKGHLNECGNYMLILVPSCDDGVVVAWPAQRCKDTSSQLFASEPQNPRTYFTPVRANRLMRFSTVPCSAPMTTVRSQANVAVCVWFCSTSISGTARQLLPMSVIRTTALLSAAAPSHKTTLKKFLLALSVAPNKQEEFCRCYTMKHSSG